MITAVYIAVYDVLCSIRYLVPCKAHLTVAGNCLYILRLGVDRSSINCVIVGPGVVLAVYHSLDDEAVLLAVGKTCCCKAVGLGRAKVVITAVYIAVYDVLCSIRYLVPCKAHLTVAGNCLYILRLGVGCLGISLYSDVGSVIRVIIAVVPLSVEIVE